MLALYAVTRAGAVPLAAPGADSLTALFKPFELGGYTALRTHQGHYFLDLDAHLARTERSMRDLGWDYTLDTGSLREALDAVCRAAAEPAMRVRVDVLAAPVANPEADGSRVLIGVESFEPLAPACYENGVSARIVAGLSREDPRIKRASFIEARKKFERADDVHEHLLVDGDGRILEGFSSNFYAVLDGALHTAGSGVLEGITRAIVLEIAEREGLGVVLHAPAVAALPHFEEAAISSASRGYLPVTKIDGLAVGSGMPGPVSQRLVLGYEACVAARLRTATGASSATH